MGIPGLRLSHCAVHRPGKVSAISLIEINNEQIWPLHEDRISRTSEHKTDYFPLSPFRPSGFVAPAPVRPPSGTSSRSPSAWPTSWSTPPRDLPTATLSRRRTSWSVSLSPTDKPSGFLHKLSYYVKQRKFVSIIHFSLWKSPTCSLVFIRLLFFLEWSSASGPKSC